jgi:hypothetical protein
MSFVGQHFSHFELSAFGVSAVVEDNVDFKVAVWKVEDQEGRSVSLVLDQERNGKQRLDTMMVSLAPFLGKRVLGWTTLYGDTPIVMESLVVKVNEQWLRVINQTEAERAAAFVSMNQGLDDFMDQAIADQDAREAAEEFAMEEAARREAAEESMRQMTIALERRSMHRRMARCGGSRFAREFMTKARS